MAASLAHWFINAAISLPHIHRAQTAMIQKVTVMITPSTVEFLLRHQAPIRFDKEAHLYAVSQHRVILLHILCIDPVVPFITSRFLLKDDYIEWCQARGEKIDQNNDVPEREKAMGVGGWLHLPCLSARPHKLSRILAHPLFKADRTLLATMDLIIIPMSILNMWHKYHSRGLSIRAQLCETAV